MNKLIMTLILAVTAMAGQYAAAADGEAIYRKSCFACHDSGAAGAPKLGNTELWAPRIAKGTDALLQSVKNGLNAMPPMGTCMTCSDEELRAAVEFIVAQAEGGGTATAGTQKAAPAATEETQAEAQPEAAPAEAAPAAEAPVTAGDPAAGEQKAATCVACHGPEGNSVNPLWPKLAGQHEDFIYKQLQAFKSGERQNELMAPIVAPLSNQDMRDLAAYFSTTEPSAGQGKPELLESGEKLYTGGNLETGVVACQGCHGPTGLGNPMAGFPRLANQHAPYVAKALRDYRGGERTNDMNRIMQEVAAKLSDAEIDALAEYVTDLQ